MVATQVLISLCLAGLTAAAPQLLLPGVQRVQQTTSSSNLNQQAIVTNVVTALQPSIADAVARALASFQTRSTSTSSTASNSRNKAFATGAVASTDSADLGPYVKPEYNYEFKVADEEAQTYITQTEQRDGDALTGTYSYVDPNGDLVTVNYEAGPNGFSQTSDKQVGFVEVRAQPVRKAPAAPTGAIASTRTSTATRSSSSSIDQSALIAQIVSALQPQISSSVNAALAAQQRSVVAVASPAVRTVSAANSGSVSSLFGDGYNVKIATPEFNIEY